LKRRKIWFGKGYNRSKLVRDRSIVASIVAASTITKEAIQSDTYGIEI